MTRAVYHSSESDTWLTPRTIADLLGPVALDPCSHPRSLVDAALRAMGPDVDGIDGLDLPWHEADGIVFVNPPYSGLKVWLSKCAAEADLGAAVVALVPARLDTEAFHASVLGLARMLAIKGRPRFAIPVEELDRKLVLPKPGQREKLERMRAAVVDGVCHVTDSAPFPCVLIHWCDPAGEIGTTIEATFSSLGKWIR